MSTYDPYDYRWDYPAPADDRQRRSYGDDYQLMQEVQELRELRYALIELWKRLPDEEKALWVLEGRKPPCQ